MHPSGLGAAPAGLGDNTAGLGNFLRHGVNLEGLMAAASFPPYPARCIASCSIQQYLNLMYGNRIITEAELSLYYCCRLYLKKSKSKLSRIFKQPVYLHQRIMNKKKRIVFIVIFHQPECINNRVIYRIVIQLVNVT